MFETLFLNGPFFRGEVKTYGNVVERYTYDPWGARRNPTDWTQKDNRTTWIVNRGYTGHEHLDKLGLINMNARLYDPVLGRFLAPDPLVASHDVKSSPSAYFFIIFWNSSS